MTRKITEWLIYIVFASLCVFDIIIAIEPSPRDTISKVMLDIFVEKPFLAYASGVLIGHITSMLPKPFYGYYYYSIPALVLVSAAILLLSLKFDVERVPVLWMFLGIFFGRYLWPQI